MTSRPLRIGYCLSLTGPLAGNSRSARLAHEIWRDDVNRRGGLLGRPVELICLDDKGDAALGGSLYARLIDHEGADLVIGGYGTNSLISALPEIIARDRYFVGLMGLGANNEFGYGKYFAIIPTGRDPNAALTEGFFDVAAQQTPRPRTVALLSADAVFSRNPVLGGHGNAAKYGIKVVHEATYPLGTTNFVPYLDAVAESGCELLFLCSYLQDSIDLVRAVQAHPYKPKMVGAAMIGPQNTQVKQALGSLLNGIVNYEYWVPAPSMAFDGVQALMESYRQRSAGTDLDPLGHYMAPLAYAQLQVVAHAVEQTQSLDDQILSEFTRTTSFPTVMGDVSFGTLGEWQTPRVLQVQFQGIAGDDLDQYRDGSRLIIVYPADKASGTLIYPFEDARLP
ncbi:amino acid ABC transporter substrate-binding protein [Paracoccus nototheniae]|uniref:Amino acid ABC transporter substrate-binding protein n=1 Tax=Paracoccus nototheniae TaxID=2489002 RepID=A0ABW4DYH5_9RHOB|nr:amino acid ABC transporter substrate-binding protein [Paracoccus nototheniae]